MSTDPNYGRSIGAFIRQVVVSSGPKFLLVIATGLFFSQLASAQTLPCRDIIAPEDFDISRIPLEMERIPIEDCNDPFGATIDPPSPYRLFINGTEVEEGSVVPVPGGTTNDIRSEGQSHQTGANQFLFLHDNDDYRYINLEPPEPTFDDYVDHASSYFSSDDERERYLTIAEVYLDGADTDEYFYDLDNDWESYIDEETGETIEERFFGFMNSFWRDYEYVMPEIGAGTYTMVWREYMLFQTQRTIWDRLRDFVLPTAYAQCIYCIPPNIYTLTFTIIEAGSEPAGASSVLFLPGIQASRLYVQEQGHENRLWEPNINADVEKLAMTEAGESINDVYTHDVLDEIYGISNIYRGLLDMLEEMKENELIEDFTPFAYDWRYDVFTAATSDQHYRSGETKRLIEEIERLANRSFTGKVTIIAHSNGGLVAKALIDQFADEGIEDMVDKIVMVGTPQLGTPKAIGSMLHGLDQSALAGLVINAETARQVIKNMPGAYTLLPSDKYFNTSEGPVITTDNSDTASSLAIYGEMDSAAALFDLLIDVLGTRNANSALNYPSVLNSEMLSKAQEFQDVLDNFQAPDDIEVYEVVGTGLPTIKGLEYREFACNNTPFCIFDPILKPVPIMTTEGDQTVVAVSAQGYEGSKVTAIVDLFLEGDQFLTKNRSHADMTESPTIKEYLGSVIKYPYINTTLEVPESYTQITSYLIIGVHSPVSLVIINEDGKKVGVYEGDIYEEIIGSEYFELAGSKYAVLPSDKNFTAFIDGQEDGIYSITIDELVGDDQTQKSSLFGLPVSTSMQSSFTFLDGAVGAVLTDNDGDGQVDLQYNWEGNIIDDDALTPDEDEEIEVDPDRTRSSGSKVSKVNTVIAGQVAGISSRELTEYEKELYKLLVQLKFLLEKWNR